MSKPTSTAVPLKIPQLETPLQLYIHGEHDLHVSHRIREEGIWEPFETSLLLSLLAPGSHFVDVGANIGYFSLIAASVVGPEGGVFAFEPDPENFSLLLASAELNGLGQCIHAVQAGLAANDAQGRLFLSEDNLGDHQVYATDLERSSLPIQLLDGSHYLADKLSRMDLLKVDTQGAEYDVMLGLTPLLHSLPEVPRILIELTPLSLRHCNSSGRALVELLAGLEQPMWIVDHIEHRLVRHTPEELAAWCDDVDAAEGDEGFMNILVGPAN